MLDLKKKIGKTLNYHCDDIMYRARHKMETKKDSRKIITGNLFFITV